MVTNVVAGCFGYCGLVGYSFRDFYAGDATLGKIPHSEVNQNFTNMLDYDSIPACIIKLSVAFILLVNYPVWNLFLTETIKKLLSSRLQIEGRS